MAGSTSLGIPAALGLYGKSLPHHLSNQLKYVKIPLDFCGGWLCHSKIASPFWKVHETLQGQDLGWVSSAHLLNWPWTWVVKDQGALKPREEDLFVLWNNFLMFTDIKMYVPLNFKIMSWCAPTQAPRTCKFYFCHCNSHLSLVKSSSNVSAFLSRKEMHCKSRSYHGLTDY